MYLINLFYLSYCQMTSLIGVVSLIEEFVFKVFLYTCKLELVFFESKIKIKLTTFFRFNSKYSEVI